MSPKARQVLVQNDPEVYLHPGNVPVHEEEPEEGRDAPRDHLDVVGKSRRRGDVALRGGVARQARTEHMYSHFTFLS